MVAIGTTTTSDMTSLIAVLSLKRLLLLINFPEVMNASGFSTFTRRTRTFAFTGYDSGRLSTIKLAPADEIGHEACALCPVSSFPQPRPISSVPPPSYFIMSQTPATIASSSSSRFQAIFQAALKSYQKQTKKDLLAHPLVSHLQDCDSTTAIITILQDQVREFDKSHSGDERLTKWLSPTVNVLNAFSATISGGVSLVRLDY